MATSYDVNIACAQIHDFIHASGLHFLIKQTPWSSYITIRRKFVNSDNFSKLANMQAMPSDLTTLLDKNQQLESKVTQFELELVNSEEEHKKATLESEEIIQNLHSEIESMQSSLEKEEAQRLILAKENTRKDEIIQNLNAGFNRKVADLKSKVDELEGSKNVVMRREKKRK